MFISIVEGVGSVKGGGYFFKINITCFILFFARNLNKTWYEKSYINFFYLILFFI